VGNGFVTQGYHIHDYVNVANVATAHPMLSFMWFLLGVVRDLRIPDNKREGKYYGV
jgi:hypothetical protein